MSSPTRPSAAPEPTTAVPVLGTAITRKPQTDRPQKAAPQTDRPQTVTPCPIARLADALDLIDSVARDTCEEEFHRMRLRIACKWNWGMQDDRIREEMEFLCSMQFRMPVVLGGRVLSHDEIALLTMTPDGYARFKTGR